MPRGELLHLHVDRELFALVKAAAARDGSTLPQWVRQTLREAASARVRAAGGGVPAPVNPYALAGVEDLLPRVAR